MAKRNFFPPLSCLICFWLLALEYICFKCWGSYCANLTQAVAAQKHEKAVLQLGPSSSEDEKELTCILLVFRVSSVKSKSPEMRRNLRFQGATLWFSLLQEGDGRATCLSLRVGERLPKQVVPPPCKAASSRLLWPRSHLRLSCIHPSVPEKGPQNLWQQTLSLPKTWVHVGTLLCPALLWGVNSTFLTEGKLAKKDFSTAGQKTSSRNKLFLALSN